MASVNGAFICLFLRILSALRNFWIELQVGSKKPYFMSTFTQYSMLTFNQRILTKGVPSWDPSGLVRVELSTWRKLL